MSEHSPLAPSEPAAIAEDEVVLPPEATALDQQPQGPSWEQLRSQFKDAGRVALSGLVEVTRGTTKIGATSGRMGIKAAVSAKQWSGAKIEKVNSAYQTKRHERLTRKQEFQAALGATAIRVATGEKPSEKIAPLKPVSFWERRKAEKVYKKAEKIRHDNGARQLKFNVYGESNGSKRSIVKTLKERRDLLGEARDEFDNGEITIDEYVAKKRQIAEKNVHKESVDQEQLTTVQQAQVDKLKRKLKVKSGSSTPLAAAPEDTSAEPESITQDEVIIEPKLSALERLRKMREDGSLPTVPARVEAKTEPTEAVVAAPEAITSAEKEETSSTEKLAEIAYITAKDEVFRLIDEEDKERAETGKSVLTKEEKAEIWKKERSIRQGLLQSLTPENRKLVNEQIGKLMQEDREARKEGKEQLRDRRRREAREAEAKKRQDAQEAKRKADQAKKDREKQAAAAVARNAAQTAIDS